MSAAEEEWRPERTTTRDASGRSYLQRQTHERIGAVLAIEVVAGRDQLLELALGNWNAGNDAANAAGFLVEVPDELAARRLLCIHAAVLGEDRDPRTEQRHLVRRDDPHALHQIDHFRRIGGHRQHREAALHNAVRRVVPRAAARRLADVFTPP